MRAMLFAMNEQAQHLDGFIVGGQHPLYESLWVQCDGYRCLAFLGLDGKWRAYATGKELRDVVKVYSAPADIGGPRHRMNSGSRI